MRSTGWRRTAAAVLLVALAGLVSGCGGDAASEQAGEELAEQVMEDSGAEGVDVDVDGEDITIESDEGTVTVGSGDVPDGFPEELSIVDGDIVSSVDTPQGVSLTVGVDDATAAFDEAVADLEANGWAQEQLTESGETRMGVFTQDDQTAMVMADSASGQLTYTIGTS